MADIVDVDSSKMLDERPPVKGEDGVKHKKFGEEETEDEAQRGRWNNRVGFYLAALGSAIGFGNVWRFPALAKDYGGGAFFVPYVMALFLIGIPILMLEIALGQYYQTSNVGVMGSFHARVRGVGLSGVFCAYLLVTYYSMLLAWVAHAFFDSWSDDAPWESGDSSDGIDYFMSEIIGMDTLNEGSNKPTRIVGTNVGYSVIVWVCIFLCIAFGSKWTGRIAYFTMGLPIILLFVFLIRACTLEGAADGIEAYIGKWDMSVLTDQADVWSTAVSQIFFSIGVTFGTMPAYGSHCPRGENAFFNAMVIGFGNSMFSFISGFAVFAAMGYAAHLEGTTVDEIPYAGFSLVFGTWPVVFGTLKGGIHWVRLLFFNLFLLGIDSAFSILEAPISVICDHHKVTNYGSKKWVVTLIFCLSAFVIGLLYATDAGLFFLDTIDFYINFVFLLLGLAESFSVGWVYGIETLVISLGREIVFAYLATFFVPVIIASSLWFGLNNENEVWGGFVALFVSFIVLAAGTLYLIKRKIEAEPEKWTWKTILYELCLRNVVDFREQLSKVVGYIPSVWGLLMKYFIPQVLVILFINLAASTNGEGEPQFGHYGGYETSPFQVLGIFAFSLAGFWIMLGMLAPDLLFGFDTTAYAGTIEAMKMPLPLAMTKTHPERLEDEEMSSENVGEKDEGSSENVVAA